VSRIKQIQALVCNGLYYLTEHADDEAMVEGFDTMKSGEIIMEFWHGERCEYCGGPIVEKKSTSYARSSENMCLSRTSLLVYVLNVALAIMPPTCSKQLTQEFADAGRQKEKFSCRYIRFNL